MKYLDLGQIEDLHHRVCRRFGTDEGIRDREALKEVVAASRQHARPLDCAIHVCREVVTRAPFEHSNDRTAFYLGLFLLALNVDDVDFERLRPVEVERALKHDDEEGLRRAYARALPQSVDGVWKSVAKSPTVDEISVRLEDE